MAKKKEVKKPPKVSIVEAMDVLVRDIVCQTDDEYYRKYYVANHGDISKEDIEEFKHTCRVLVEQFIREHITNG